MSSRSCSPKVVVASFNSLPSSRTEKEFPDARPKLKYGELQVGCLKVFSPAFNEEKTPLFLKKKNLEKINRVTYDFSVTHILNGSTQI